MLHLPELIQDLGFILAMAGAAAFIFKKLKQPVVLGYLLAGFLLGPHIPFIPTVQDTESVKIWAEIGVIILLFGLGLEFSFKKLAQTGRAATITALFEVIFMLLIGYVAGILMGWTQMDSLFLGGILAISSTTIIVRAFDELGLKNRKFVSLVFGVLIVEDIAAILLLVLLSTVAVSQIFSGTDLVLSAAKLGFFLVLWFVLGIYLIPLLIHRIRGDLNNESTLIVALGLCLVMVMIASAAGFSPALGAFVMGSLLAETREGTRIEHLIHPVRDLFAAIFFVSVGMLIEPRILLEYAPEILIICAITIIGKFLSTTIGALTSGASLRHSVQSGLSLAQIGEFSFIIATLGLTLKVTSEFLYPIAVSVSAITTFTTPYLIKSMDKVYGKIDSILPKGIRQKLENYQSSVSAEGEQYRDFTLLWKAYGGRISLNTVLVVAIFLSTQRIALIRLHELLPEQENLNSILLTILALLLASPFFWSIVFNKNMKPMSKEQQERVLNLSFGFSIARSCFAFGLAVMMLQLMLPPEFLLHILILACFILFVRRVPLPRQIYLGIERTFIQNLDGNAPDSFPQRPKVPPLAPWDVSLVDFKVHPNSALVGQTLMQVQLKEKFGVTVALVERGENHHLAPDRNFIFMPHDRVFVIGSEEQLERVQSIFEAVPRKISDEESVQSFGLRSVRLMESSPFAGKTLRDSGLRERVSGLVVGIERSQERILSPSSDIVLLPGDLLWIVGELQKIHEIA